ncbi:hypothetical protein ACSLBF_08765 [Pseudoalteromonas sp. T1lg65]|uniref:hypothetical protein n=1 Tax=Pseudoalteromonas sp. T1lg65 TaxID=2077101 RepID=UPI003F7A72A6
MIGWFRSYVEQLILKKHAGPRTTLSHNTIYILPSKDGWLFLTIALVNFILGVNYQNNLILATAYLMALLMLLSLLMAYFNFNGLTIHYLGTKANFSPCSPLAQFELNAAHPVQALVFSSTSLALSEQCELNGNNTQIDMPLNACKQRGKYKIKKVSISSNYPFGLVKVWSYLYLDDDAYVYPTPLATQLSGISYTHDGVPEQDSLANEALSEQLYRYQKGMPVNRVAWKIYAKTDQLFIKQTLDVGQYELNDNEVFYRFDELNGDKETRLSNLSYLINQAQNNNIKYGMQLGSLLIKPAHGEQHLKRCMESLSEF